MLSLVAKFSCLLAGEHLMRDDTHARFGVILPWSDQEVKVVVEESSSSSPSFANHLTKTDLESQVGNLEELKMTEEPRPSLIENDCRRLG